MTRYNYDQSYLYFNIGVVDTDFKEMVRAASVHYCLLFVVDELYLGQHDKTRYSAILLLDNGTKIELHEYSLNDIDRRLQEMVTPIWLMKQIYDDSQLKPNRITNP